MTDHELMCAYLRGEAEIVRLTEALTACRAQGEAMREALTDVLSRWASAAVIDAVDDDSMSGIRPCPPNSRITIADTRRWRAALSSTPKGSSKG